MQDIANVNKQTQISFLVHHSKCTMPKEASFHIVKGGLYCALTQVSTFYLRLVTSVTLGCALVLLNYVN